MKFVTSTVKIALMNLAGEMVLVKDLGGMPAGVSRSGLDLGLVASGVYLAVLEVDEGYGSQAKAFFKMAVVRP